MLVGGLGSDQSILLFADGSTGEELGYILTDAIGSVVTNTLPATLTQKLAGHLDATDLQYDGLRYYDPWAGMYVQPDPFGGARGRRMA